MIDELSPEAHAILTDARNEERAPSAEELRRIRSNVLLGIAPAGLVLGAAGTAAASELTVLSVLGLAAKGAALGTAVALGGYAVQRSFSEPPPAPVIVRAAASSNARDEVPAERRVGPLPAPVDVEQLVAPSTPSSRGSTTALPDAVEDAKSSSAELLEEVETLRRVQELLSAGRGIEALRVLDASSSRLGQGQLRQERLAAEVFAACESGQLERARQAARRFVQENPATPSAARLKTSCVGGELDRP